jgi:hypothetical protein
MRTGEKKQVWGEHGWFLESQRTVRPNMFILKNRATTGATAKPYTALISL